MRNHRPGRSGCLSEQQLVAMATGDALLAERGHVSACAGCARRVAEIGAELRLIVGALRSDGAEAGLVRRPRRFVWIGATAAAAALAIVAIGLGVQGPSQISVPPAAAEQRAFLESISRAMFVAQGYDRWLQGSYPVSTLDAGRACGWGSLAMPCDVAWAADDDRIGR